VRVSPWASLAPPSRSVTAPFNLLDQGGDAHLRNVVDWLHVRGERGHDIPTDVDPVEACDGQLVGNSHTGRTGCTHRANGHEVIRREHGIGSGPVLQQA
jgi:hypothetical protein